LSPSRYSRLCFDVVLTSEIYVDVFDSHSVCIVMIFQLGMGDWSEFMDKIQEVVPMDQQPELLQKLSDGSFTLRIM